MSLSYTSPLLTPTFEGFRAYNRENSSPAPIRSTSHLHKIPAIPRTAAPRSPLRSQKLLTIPECSKLTRNGNLTTKFPCQNPDHLSSGARPSSVYKAPQTQTRSLSAWIQQHEPRLKAAKRNETKQASEWVNEVKTRPGRT